MTFVQITTVAQAMRTIGAAVKAELLTSGGVDIQASLVMRMTDYSSRETNGV